MYQVYRCIGHADIWGMYGVYKHTGGCTDEQGMYRHMGVYRCVGGVQTYAEHTEYGGAIDVCGCIDVGSHRHPYHTDSQTYPHIPANYTWVLYFL